MKLHVPEVAQQLAEIQDMQPAPALITEVTFGLPMRVLASMYMCNQ